MRVPLPVACIACGEKFSLEVTGSSNLPEYSNCPKCGAQPYNVWPLGNIATKLLMERARQELASNDMTLGILLGAVAVEAEMSYLFFKWRGIDSGMLSNEQTAQDRKQWEDEWANMRSIGNRLERLSLLLTKKPFDEFARLKISLLKPALADHDPAASIKDFFQGQFFERRNDIVHYGQIDFEKLVGERCLLSATNLLSLLHAMDNIRYDLTFPKK